MEYITNIKEAACGWVGPRGQVYALKHYSGALLDHENLADEIVRNNEVKHDVNNTYSCVECEGWIKFSPDLIIAEAKAGEIKPIQQRLINEWLSSDAYDKVNKGFIQLGFSKYKDNCFTSNQVKSMDLISFACHICTGK